MAKLNPDESIETTDGQLQFFEVEDDKNVDDDTELEVAPATKFKITSYGADLSVFDLQRRLGNELLIPAPFQRKFVWNQKQASRFIESILLGLPVPGIFVYLKDKKQLIVDGQQRLITLQRFMAGVWDRKTRKQGQKTVDVETPFSLQEVAEPWTGKTFSQLDIDDQQEIENYLIHTTIFRQDHPTKKDRSIYEVFERINTGGLRLSPQEIRACVSHGEFVGQLEKMADRTAWRDIYGRRSPRLKDEELILRFFAFLDDRNNYTRPMRVFLDNYLEAAKDTSKEATAAKLKTFEDTLRTLSDAIGPKLFRPENAINAAVYDSVMVGCAVRIARGPVTDSAGLATAYSALLVNPDYEKAYKRATADDESVKSRLRLAVDAFAGVK